MSLVIAIYLCLILNTGALSKIQKIIGGEDADISEYPYTASLRYVATNHHFCGGAIISNRHILTAAHCLVDETYSQIVVFTGSTTSRSMSGSVFSIEEVFMNPEYTDNSIVLPLHLHDLAIIKLNEYIIFNEYQKKIELPTEEIKPGNIVIVSGWGITHFTDIKSSNILQKVALPILSIEDCSLYYALPFNQGLLCTNNGRGTGVCMGDSGGPLAINGILVGISSFIVPCALGSPDIYTNVYSYLPFIRSII